MSSGNVGLTEQESKVLYHLVDAWNDFLKLEGVELFQENADDFRFHMNSMQRIIGMRVVRRADPDVWFMGSEFTG